MIALLRGLLWQVERESVILDVQGVGYQVRLSQRHLRKLPPKGQEVTLVTQLLPREDSLDLYGFESSQEKEVFLSLTRVSGIGARTALALISELPVQEIIKAIVMNQPKLLARAPGVGLKTAQRVILELKEKLGKMGSNLPPSVDSSHLANDTLEEVEMTLLALGYSGQEIQDALQKFVPNLSAGMDAEAVIRYLLENLS